MNRTEVEMMKLDKYIVDQVMNKISEGIICIDKNNCISFINERAKEIFGISSSYEIGHDSGALENGDILIFGDNNLGYDDGGLNAEDLHRLGVQEDIQDKSAVVFIGIYGGISVYKHISGYSTVPLEISKKFKGLDIKVTIDFIKRFIDISIDETSIRYDYIKGIGHMVILDGNSSKLKFYQSKGYSVRGEDLRSLICGKHFAAKNKNGFSPDVIGEKIDELLDVSKSIKKLIACARGEQLEYIDEYDEINRRPVRCSIYALKTKDGEASGACLKFEDMSDLKSMIEERDTVLRKLEEIEQFDKDNFSMFIGESPEIKEVKNYSRKSALSTANVLILGESGTGKSILAHMIHDFSNRTSGKFVEVNCGAISENLLESELFGYVPGAFTGANSKGKQGLIEYADKGTLFLDEISEMPYNLQVKLLHVIQNRWILPVGATKAREIDVRFIFASNKDLVKLIAEGKFREDLYYRINVLPVMIPPLREHKEDLHYLVISVIHKLCRKDGINIKTVSNEAFNKLYSYNFPGNVRELENIIERAINIANGDIIDCEDIIINEQINQDTKPLKRIIEDVEKRTISNYLKRFSGDKVQVMKALDIKKTALYDKIKKYNLE